ncbi:MAG: winged helix DNA-binding domain-containing protein [Solirubrobacteraceae bacterium]
MGHRPLDRRRSPRARRASGEPRPLSHAARLAAQGLTGPPLASPEAVCERLLAVQGQDGRGFRLAVRSRTAGLSASDVDAGLSSGALLVTWLNRGTLHLVRSEDHPWLFALTTPQLRTGNLRRLEQEGVSARQAEKGVKIIEKEAAGGPVTRAVLRERLSSAGVPVAGQAFIHVVFLAALRGLIVRGPVIDGEHCFVLLEDWLGPQPAVDRDAALRELGRRYLAGHGPADARDLAKWAGIGLRDARAALAGQPQAAAPPQCEDAAARPKLLGPFDPLLLGWADRRPVVGDHAGIVTSNGIFRPIALVEGRAAATWTMPRGIVQLAPFGRLSKAVRDALAAEAADVERFLAS